MTKDDKKIIIVDDNDTNLVACKNILKTCYIVYPARSAAKMFDLIEHFVPDLILLDVEMPEMNGYEAAQKLKQNDAHKDIPIIFLTGKSDAESEVNGLKIGALDFIHKPFVSEVLLRRLEIHLALIDCRKKIDEKEKTLNRINYEIRAPLNRIIDTLCKAAVDNDPGKVKDYINSASDESRRLLTLIDEIVSSPGNTVQITT